MRGRSRLSVAFIFVAGLAVAAFLLQATPLLFGASQQSASSGPQGHDTALAKLLKGSGAGSQLSKEVRCLCLVGSMSHKTRNGLCHQQEGED